MTISTINTKSGTNGILPHRTKRGITLDLKSNRKSIYSALIWYKIHILFEQISYLEKLFSDCTILFDTHCILKQGADPRFSRARIPLMRSSKVFWCSYDFSCHLNPILKSATKRGKHIVDQTGGGGGGGGCCARLDLPPLERFNG